MGGMMAKRSAFLDIIKEKGALVLDGALGTELERYGCDIQHKLWSAKVLMDQPDIIKKIHISYLAAGVDIIQSSGYQATVAGFKGLGYGTEEAIELVKLSVRLAVQARNEFLEAKASGALTLHGIKLGEVLTPDQNRIRNQPQSHHMHNQPAALGDKAMHQNCDNNAKHPVRYRFRCAAVPTAPTGGTLSNLLGR